MFPPLRFSVARFSVLFTALIVINFVGLIAANAQSPVYIREVPFGGIAKYNPNGEIIPNPNARLILYARSYLTTNPQVEHTVEETTITVTTGPDGRFSASFPCYTNNGGNTWSGAYYIEAKYENTTAGASIGGSTSCPEGMTFIDALTPIGESPGADRQNLGEDGCASVAKPINTTNGNMWLSQTDYNMAGTKGGIRLNRIYNSQDTKQDYSELAGKRN